ncbi:SDR family NAD(P)-dependent oxidoreductase [Ruminiclostridium cellulolyticum]|uniref:Beta-ketoacyl synthase n=1 Tax=Ruminiclostridium cellulolyticum (strain ATCC 35319 / DSM 5812 / JCM 6584 / H10) TaxID=394503 RepID=B8I8K0_RUMCH|nr:SDR family NAD(P)-dependent oxidoreductase [Ruminiclostridium cellulolyticum]ACL75233.1 Beta-ketoacyl synthase [Ruminiclostridium cellulolyticum H10]
MTNYNEFEFYTTVRSDDYVVRDHRVHQVRIMPGVTFLDIVYRILNEEGFDLSGLELRNILFKEPIAVTEAFDKEICIKLKNSKEFGIITALSRKVKDDKILSEEWDLNFQCELNTGKEKVSKTIDIEKLKKDAVKVIDTDEAYAHTRKINIHHFEFMKALGDIYIGEGYLMAEVHLSDLAKEFLGDFYLHPAYMDFSTLVPYKLKNLEIIEETVFKPFIPIYIESFRAFDSLKDLCYIYVKEENVTLTKSQDVTYADWELFGEDGEVETIFKRMAAKCIRSKELIEGLQEIGKDLKQKATRRQAEAPVQPAYDIPEKRNEADQGEMSQLELIRRDLKELVARVQGVAVDKVSLDAGFYDQGLDSSNLLQLVQEIEYKVGQQLYPTLLFEYTNICELADFLVKEYGNGYKFSTKAQETEKPVIPMCFNRVWEKSDPKITTKKPENGTTVVFDSNRKLYNALKSFDKNTLLVEPGESFKYNGTDIFVINPDSPEDYNSLTEILKEKGMLPERIVYLWNKEETDCSAEEVQVGIQKGVYSVFYLTRALMEQKLKNGVDTLYIYKTKKGGQPYNSALSGFAKAANAENPKFTYRVIGVEGKETGNKLLDVIQRELNIEAGTDTDVLYKDGARYSKHFKRIYAEQKPKATVVKENGVYLITGGAGGLGIIFAEHLASIAKVRLVLTGRSKVDGKKENQFNKLERNGSRVTYISCDVSNRNEVNRLISDIKSKFGEINGVIHSAGVIRDAYILKKTTEEMNEVFASKVYGTIYLDEALKNEKLDFFVLFSSMAAVVGNSGQCDYAYANGFIDGYAGYREFLVSEGTRFGRTIAFNWPLWKNGGMGIDEQTLSMMRARGGIVPLNTENGLKTFEDALTQPYSQLLVVEGEEEKVLNALRIGEEYCDVGEEKGEFITAGEIEEIIKQSTAMKKADSVRPGNNDDDIAIIGFSGRYPMAKDVDEFWENLKNGKDCVSEIPADRYDWREYFDPDKNKIGKTYTKWGGFIDDADKFDPLFFNISPREAEVMDPQERMFLETVWRAIEDSGNTKTQLSKGKTGVFVGVMWGQYNLLETEINGRPTLVNTIYASIANRVSYTLNFRGPSIALDTMCSSSLTAIHLACDSIRKGESDIAIAGGVNLSLQPNKYVFLSQQKFTSSEGKCRAFGDGGDGYVPGEGIGAIILKPLKKAVANGDRIYAVIKGSTINHGGKTSGFTVPNPNSQAALMSDVLKKSNINPRTISYIEAHGTGTSLGDPIEIKGLLKAFGEYTNEKGFCSIGSVKSNIGHLESASGIAGITKVLLQMKYKMLVPSIHTETLNSKIDFKESQFYVQRELSEWKQPVIVENGVEKVYPRRAGISSFGAGGSNAHIILEEYGNNENLTDNPKTAQIVVLSAKTREQLKEYAQKLYGFIGKNENSSLRLCDIAYTLMAGREAMDVRISVVAKDLTELSEKLNCYIEERPTEGLYEGNLELTRPVGGDMNALLKEGDLDAIAKAWAGGISINPSALSEGYKPQIVSLPTYPFAKESFKIDMTKASNKTGNGFSALHPLVDINQSTLEEESFKKTLSQEEFFLKDHIVGGKTMLPGAAFIEMARAAGHIAGKNPVKTFRDIVWARPITLSGKAHDVNINLYTDKTGILYEVSGIENGSKVVYSQGKLGYELPETASKEKIDLEEVKKRCTYTKSMSESYSLFKQMGFDYGNSFKVTKQMWSGDKEALVKLKLPEELSKGFNEFGLHPSLMDGALRTVIGVGLREAEKNPTLRIPFALGQIEIFKPLEEECLSYAHLSDESQGEILKYDITILSLQGEVLVKIKDFQTRAYKLAVAGNKAELKDLIYYKASWEKMEITRDEYDVENIKKIDSVIVFDTGHELQNEFEMLLNSTAREQKEIILVKPGTSFNRDDDKTYTINPKSHEDYQELFKSLTQQGKSITNIIHLWSMNSNTLDLSGKIGCNELIKKLDSTNDTGLYSIMYIFRAVTALKLENRTRCLFTFKGGRDNIQVCQEAVSGFANSITSVNHRFELISVQFDEYTLENVTIPPVLAVELTSKNVSNGMEISYENGERFIKQISRVEELGAGDSNILKPQGVYIITGGVGGLGMIFARYLAKKYNARLALTGRSPFNKDTEEKLSSLKGLGGEAIYCRGDIVSTEDTQRIVKEVKDAFGGIDGIIHSAGLSGEKSVMEVDRNDFEKIMLAKTHGLINLDLTTKDEALDFIALFSSISSIVGDFGGCSYATANSFLDRYAYARSAQVSLGNRKGITLSIDWPLWGGGGLELPEEMAALYFEYSGMKPINAETGLKAFEDALRSGCIQLIVAGGDNRKVDRALKVGRGKGAEAASVELMGEISLQETENKPEGSQESMILEQAEEYLKGLLSNTINLPAERINAKLPLEKYGIDSVMIMEINSLLEKDFDSLPKTLLFEYSNLHDLAKYFVKNHSSKIMEIRKIEVEPEQHLKATNREIITSSNDAATLKPFKSRFTNSTLRSESVSSESGVMDIAIIGLSGQYPMAENLEEFWENLKVGKDCITEIPLERWDYRDYYDPDRNKKGKVYSKWGGFIDDADKFDPFFFNISPREAELLDPQERIFLETAWETIEDSGYTRKTLADKRVGVFVATMFAQSQIFSAEEQLKGNPYSAWTFFSSVANRVSYFMNFNGPSLSVDTACSSALEAIRQGCQNILSGNCDMAIAGGVNLTLHPSKYVFLCSASFLSSDGRCRSFGEGGDGYVPGEGVGAVMLKPLHKAVADGDHIYGVIKGISINHGGKTNGYTVPSPNAQADLISDVLNKTGINAKTISYIEAHGTGTSLGDPIEITGLQKSFREHTEDRQYCSIGSVKSNIGHLESAAGVAAVTKVLLQMKHKKLVPSLHSKVLNLNIDFEQSPFVVQQSYEEWKQPIEEKSGITKKYPRRAGISGFGAGGTNVHIILEEYEPKSSGQDKKNMQIVVLSAKNEDRLKAYANKLLTYLEKNTEQRLKEVIDENEVIERIKDDISGIASGILDIDREEIDQDEDIDEYGFDPLAIETLCRAINAKYGNVMEPAVVSGCGSITGLAKQIGAGRTEDLGRLLGIAPKIKSIMVEADSDSTSLENIAYTLQVGREAFEERLAVTVSSIGELKEKLAAFCDGKSNIDRLYRGNTRSSNSDMDFLIDGKEGDKYFKSLIESKNLSKIGRLWVSGVDIDWDRLYMGTKPGKVSLPTYPFDKESYWYPRTGKIIHTSERVTANTLHPMLECNVSTLKEQRYVTTLTEDMPFISDHLGSDMKILSSLALLEAALAAGELSAEEKVKVIQGINWGSPIVVSGDNTELSISLYSADPLVEFEVSTLSCGKRIIHCQGTIGFEASPAETSFNYKVFKNKCSSTDILNSEEFYLMLGNIGLKYGENFKVVKEWAFMGNQAATLMVMPDTKEQTNDFTLNPTLLEGIMQTATALLKERDDVYMTLCMDAISIFKPLTKECHVQTVLREDKGGLATFDINIFDLQGQVLVSVKNLSLKVPDNIRHAIPDIDDGMLENLLKRLEEGELDEGNFEQLLGGIINE